MMIVENKPFDISVEQLAAVLLNARNLVGEISELMYYAKEGNEND